MRISPPTIQTWNEKAFSAEYDGETFLLSIHDEGDTPDSGSTVKLAAPDMDQFCDVMRALLSARPSL